MRGISLVELMVALFIFSTLLTGTYGILSMGHTAFNTGDAQIIVQQEARKAMDKLTKEIREASSVSLESDYPFTIHGQKIKYEVSNNQLLRQVQGESSSILANNISNLQFTVYGGDIVYITIQTEKYTVFGRRLSVTVNSQVILRN